MSRLINCPSSITAIAETAKGSNIKEAKAFLGGEKQPALRVSRCPELYWDLSRDKIKGKSEDQLRRWKNPRKKAVANFITVCGDKAITDITPDDMLDFRAWWMDKIEAEGLNNTSANKDFIHLGDVLKTINNMKRLSLILPLTGLAFKENDKKQRPAFSDKRSGPRFSTSLQPC